ncbi:DUF5996 family protein [Chitinophaga rhizosphaerae]|uniref:DUF5996 family protein n=1 Tax=Chitinophaga rhizosphaerae TaxID=1864947 RepID=UPI000F8047DD|nr:DUF5996 family protein [Chitinophaga rhizosphaerae]
MKTKWPVLQYDSWKDTLATVHRWTQVVGKVRLRKMPWLNHSWHVTLFVSPTGLTTGSVPYGNGLFQIDFDFVHHRLRICTSEGRQEQLELRPMAVADFYHALFEKLKQLSVDVEIFTMPAELQSPIPFEEDYINRSYDAKKMEECWRAMVQVHTVFMRFRSGFTGKVSPVHFFWGAFDLAVTRFSGRDAPEHTGSAPNMPARVMQEAYSKEVSSCGFWPGNDSFPQAAFYSYAYPSPEGFASQPVQPAGAYFDNDLGEFILPYSVVQQSSDPEKTLLDFLQSTYEAAANTAHWDRHALECDLSPFENAYGCFRV